MILKGSERGGPTQLAAHLLNERDNDHVELHDLRGFVANDLFGALKEVQAVKKVAAERRRFGYRLIHVMLERQGVVMNQNKLRRLYR